MVEVHSSECGLCYCSLMNFVRVNIIWKVLRCKWTFFAALMNCYTVNIIWKMFHSSRTVELELQLTLIQWKLPGRDFTASWQCFCSLNGLCFSEHYVEGISQHVDSFIAAWWNLMQWTFCGRYLTAVGLWYCNLKQMCYSELYLKYTSQQVDSGISARIKCNRVNIIWKILQRKWTVILHLEWHMIQWTLSRRYFTVGGQWFCSLNEVWSSEHYLAIFAVEVCDIAAW